MKKRDTSVIRTDNKQLFHFGYLRVRMFISLLLIMSHFSSLERIVAVFFFWLCVSLVVHTVLDRSRYSSLVFHSRDRSVHLSSCLLLYPCTLYDQGLMVDRSNEAGKCIQLYIYQVHTLAQRDNKKKLWRKASNTRLKSFWCIVLLEKFRWTRGLWATLAHLRKQL